MWKESELFLFKSLKNLLFIAFFTLGFGETSHALTHDGAVVILPLTGKGGLSPYQFVSNDVEPALAGQVKVVDSQGYFRELRRQRLPVKKAFTKRIILKVAPKIGAKQALVLESTTVEEGSGRRRRRVELLRAAMIDVERGTSLFVYQWPLANGAFSPRIARDLVRRILEVLPERAQIQSGGFAAADGWSADSVASESWSSGNNTWGQEPAQPQAPAAAREESASPVADDGRPAVVQSEASATQPVTVEESGSGARFDVGLSNPYEDISAPTFSESVPSVDNSNSSGATPTPVLEPTSATQAVVVASEPPVQREWLSLSLGGGAMQRVGYVPKPTADGSNPTTYAACFCGPLGEINPMFASVAGSLEIYPFRINGGDGLAHLGLRADLSVGSVTTTQESGESFSSTVLDWDLAAVYQIPLWNQRTAPTLSLALGYASMSFPLEAGPFPGLSYSGPSFSLTGALPLGGGVTIGGAGGLRLPLTLESEQATFAADVSAWAWTAQLSASYDFEEHLGLPLSFGIQAKFLGINGTLSGESILPGNVSVVDASLVDLYRTIQSTLTFRL